MRGLVGWTVVVGLLGSAACAVDCVGCHTRVTPGIVADWQASAHARKDVDCSACHGDLHEHGDDVNLVKIPTPETCRPCHEQRVEQFSQGKHAKAWSAMKAMPTFHWQPMTLTDGMKGCGGCHKIGLKTADEIMELKKQGNGYGTASCDACHTRHTFAVAEARQPQACMTCHTGFDHPQWEMYSGSKHGVRYLLKQNKVLPETTSAPTCQTCHMSDRNHAVRTAWGFLGARQPLPADATWAAAQTTILQALGAADPQGAPTPRLGVLKAADVLRTTTEDWQAEGEKMTRICARCHAETYARNELKKGDDMVRAADLVMADGIKTVASLYRDGLLRRPTSYAWSFPDLLTFHDAPTGIEQRLFVMFSEHRMRAFQGTFHNNPDYALWYGWSELRRDLTELQERAADLRRRR